MPLKSPPFYLIVFLTVCLVDPVWCKIIYVPKDFLTIQTAIENCQNKDQIIVAPGHYRENLRFNGQDIILRSTNPNDLEIVQQTVVDGGGISAVVTLSGDETSACQIAGLTLPASPEQIFMAAYATKASAIPCEILYVSGMAIIARTAGAASSI